MKDEYIEELKKRHDNDFLKSILNDVESIQPTIVDITEEDYEQLINSILD